VKLLDFLKLIKRLVGNSKWYALADIAINEGDVEAFKQNKGRITDTSFDTCWKWIKLFLKGRKEKGRSG
jgi:hypothetical protein